ncbi:MAG: hypothetical protein HKN43_08045 [Rhodothermales bacterium]|nr:hypothetical protein [Rhodothermales bacterium]
MNQTILRHAGDFKSGDSLAPIVRHSIPTDRAIVLPDAATAIVNPPEYIQKHFV